MAICSENISDWTEDFPARASRLLALIDTKQNGEMCFKNPLRDQ